MRSSRFISIGVRAGCEQGFDYMGPTADPPLGSGGSPPLRPLADPLDSTPSSWGARLSPSASLPSGAGQSVTGRNLGE